jgi:hypothetical protein
MGILLSTTVSTTQAKSWPSFYSGNFLSDYHTTHYQQFYKMKLKNNSRIK